MVPFILYLHGPAVAAAAMVERVLEVSAALDRGLSANRLCLNQDKTQYIMFLLKRHLKSEALPTQEVSSLTEREVSGA